MRTYGLCHVGSCYLQASSLWKRVGNESLFLSTLGDGIRPVVLKFVFVKASAWLVLSIVLAAIFTRYGFWIDAGTSTLAGPVAW